MVGLGMIEVELKENPRLDAHVVQDLNANPKTLPFDDGECGERATVDFCGDSRGSRVIERGFVRCCYPWTSIRSGAFRFARSLLPW